MLWVAPKGLVGALHQICVLLKRRGAVQSETWDIHDCAQPQLSPRARATLFAEQLSMQFGGVLAVERLSFAARPGVVTSLIGPNGAGKSTALNMLSGFYQPSEGRVRLGERGLEGRGAQQVSRAGVARTYQTSQLFDSLSVLENVLLALTHGRLGALLGNRVLADEACIQQAHALLVWCGYRGNPHALAGDLPHVDRRLVEIARALATDPEILLLDEPAAGLSREDKEQLALVLRRIADAGIGVLVVEHDMALVMGISDHVVVLESGKHLAEGSPQEVQANPLVQQAYLGESLEGAERPERIARPLQEGKAELLGVGSLVAGYGAAPVLHGIDLCLRQGEVIALLGANGAGKSTLMRSLSGLHRPISSGGIHLDGEDLTALNAEAIVARGMVLVPEGRQVFPELSVLDNIRLGGFLQTQDQAQEVEAMMQRFPRLRERLHQRAGLLSGGEQQMLAIARALMSKPRVLLLDEPSLGLAPKIISELFQSMEQLRREGMTLLVVDQMAGLALALADRAYVMSSGRMVAEGSCDTIAADPSLSQAYLGTH